MGLCNRRMNEILYQIELEHMESYIMKFDSKWLKKNTKKGVPSNFSTGTEWISNDLKTRIL